MKPITAYLIAFCSFGGTAAADIMFEFDPTDLTTTSNGLNQSFAIDLLATHNGTGDNTLSGFTLLVADPGVGLTISAPASSPFVWSLGGPSVSPFGTGYAIGASSFTNNMILSSGTTTLATVTFNLDSSISSHTFPLNLTLQNAARSLFLDISSEVSVVNSNFTVQSAAVPEPSSATVFAALSALGFILFRGRRRQLVVAESPPPK